MARTAVELLDAISTAKIGRRAAEESHRQYTADLRDALREAKAHPKLSIMKAAKYAGISRQAAYDLLKQRRAG